MSEDIILKDLEKNNNDFYQITIRTFLTAKLQQLLCLQFPQLGFNLKLQTCYGL